jgi:hypothetical protein
LKNLQSISLDKEYIGDVEFQGKSATEAKPIEYLLEPKGRLLTVGPEQVAVGCFIAV